MIIGATIAAIAGAELLAEPAIARSAGDKGGEDARRGAPPLPEGESRQVRRQRERMLKRRTP
jgi:hypothetical protein